MIKTKDAKLINEIIKNSLYQEKKEEILKLLEKNNYRRYFFGQMPDKFDDLSKIDYLLDIMVKEEQAYKFIEVVRNSVNGDNAELILNKIKKYYFVFELEDLYETHQQMVLRTVKDIIKKFPQYIKQVYEIVKMVIDEHSKDYKDWKARRNYEEEKREIGEILNIIFDYYIKQKRTEEVKKIAVYIQKKFNFVQDDGEMMFYTPPSLFNILKKYIDYDFENFNKIKKFIAKKYSEEWLDKKGETAYEGWELSGGGMSYSGSNYRIGDRFYVQYIFQPILKELYDRDQEEGWKFIKENCITAENQVNINRPDFLNRAVLPIIINRYLENDGERAEEAGAILEDFVMHKKGIPHKSEIIFNALRKETRAEKIKPLVYKYIEEYQIPSIPIIYQLLAQLAIVGDELIIGKLENWITEEEFLRRIFFGHEVTGLIIKIADKNFGLGLKLFEKFIFSEHFSKKFESFDVFELADFHSNFRNEHFDEWIRIQNKIINHPELPESKNLQILLGYSLYNSKEQGEESAETLMKVYNEFIKDKILSKKHQEICDLMPCATAREAFVKFAEQLAKNNKITEALEIIKFFIEDPDPYMTGRDQYDKKAENNEHKRIEEGEDNPSITSVRGWCAWALMHCAVLQGRDKIKIIYDYTKRLLDDKNYYIKHMACFPLGQLARIRLTVLPDNRKKLFLDINNNKEEALKFAKEIEKTAFNFLKEIVEDGYSQGAKKVLGESILGVFNNIRSLTADDAIEFFNNIEELPNEVIEEVLPLYLYFILFRKNSYLDWEWKARGLYNDLDNFKPEKIEEKLFALIEKYEKNINRALAWNLWKVTRELKEEDYNNIFGKLLMYAKKIAGNYDHEVYNRLYMFIKDNFEKKSNECYELYKICLNNEVKTLCEMSENKKITNETHWWESYYHKGILYKIHSIRGDSDFLDMFELISKYPKEIMLFDIGEALSILEKFPKDNDRVRLIFEALEERGNPEFFEYKEKWENQK